jgi:hypothetical protein
MTRDVNDRLGPFRTIDQNMSDSNFYFELTGYVHGKKILYKPLSFYLSGKKIVKSI